MKGNVLNLNHLDFDIVSTVRCPVENFVIRISDFASTGISTLVERTLQIHLFMQNKANFQKSQMNTSDLLLRDYEQLDTWWNGKKQSQTKPIKAKKSQF